MHPPTQKPKYKEAASKCMGHTSVDCMGDLGMGIACREDSLTGMYNVDRNVCERSYRRLFSVEDGEKDVVRPDAE